MNVLKNQAELIRTFEAKNWRYDKAESVHVRIWSQLLNNWEIQNPSQWISWLCSIVFFSTAVKNGDVRLG